MIDCTNSASPTAERISAAPSVPGDEQQRPAPGHRGRGVTPPHRRRSRRHTGTPGRGGVEDEAAQHPVLDEHVAATRQALGVVGRRPEGAGVGRVVDEHQ